MCSDVLDELQLSNGLLWKAGEETITIIHPAGDKGMNKFLQVLTGNKTSNSCNVCLVLLNDAVLRYFLDLTAFFHILLWNSLPDNVRGSDTLSLFKSRLKTHLFSQAFI